MLKYEKIDVSEEIHVIKQVHQKNVNFVVIGFLKILDLNLKRMFVIDVMINDGSFFKKYSDTKRKRKCF